MLYFNTLLPPQGVTRNTLVSGLRAKDSFADVDLSIVMAGPDAVKGTQGPSVQEHV